MTVNGSTKYAQRITQQVVENGPINLLRLLAALLVAISHARTLFLVDYDDAPHDVFQTAMYGVTALGHQAVVVFFVLSGFWVGGSAIRKFKRGTFSWPSYLADRVVRLWTVLLPALVLTLVLDLIGRHYFGSMTAYSGDPGYGAVVATPPRPIDFITFTGNFFFMGGIGAPTLGSNTALWSLSFEFWMYMIGPLVLFIMTGRGRKSIVLAGLAIVAAWLVGPSVLAYVPIWLLGTAVAMYAQKIQALVSAIKPTNLLIIRLFAAGLTLAVALLVRGLNSLPAFVSDYVVAVPAAFLLATLTTGYIKNSTEASLLGRFARLANCSYSLYAIHTPILIFIVSLLGIQESNRWAATPISWLGVLLLIIAVTVIGWLFAQVTEKHTDRIRRYLKRAMHLS